jgi:hypothetical protein
VTIEDNPWHDGSDGPPPALWQFLGSARQDVLTLAAELLALTEEVPWLRARLAIGQVPVPR